MKTNSRMIAVALAAFLIGAGLPALVVWNPAEWQWADHIVGRHRHAAPGAATEAGATLWTCGMHPQVIQDQPGSCPICGMRLVPVQDTSAGAPETSAAIAGRGDEGAPERKIRHWRAPMDPTYVSDKPGKSPMGMDLVPVYEDEQPLAAGVRVDPNFLQNFGIRTAVVERGSIPIEIRTVGILANKEEKLVSVNTKFEGWIEKAHYNNIGEHVHRGDVLFEIYSPQLVTTQQEYLAALDYLEKLSSSGYDDAVERARSLVEAARERLHYWDIGEEQIAGLERAQQPSRTLEVLAPASGHIFWKMQDSLEGMKLAPGMTVLKIADHSTLWAEVELFEHQIRHVRQGQRAVVRVSAFPGRTWQGKIVFFEPAVNPQTRTLRAFIEIPNHDLELRPQMFADVLLKTPAVSGAVKVPEEAVLHSGERSVVVVQKDTGLFEPREVEVGTSGGGYQEIRSGLRPGETVVTSSQFLIDSESNLKAAIRQLLSERGASQAGGVEASPTSDQH